MWKLQHVAHYSWVAKHLNIHSKLNLGIFCSLEGLHASLCMIIDSFVELLGGCFVYLCRLVLPSSGAQVRQELQGRVDELKSYPELLSAAEQSLFECQANLQRSERTCSEKAESIRQLQVKVCNVSCECHRMWSAVKFLRLTTRWYYSPICLPCCEFVLIFVIERASDCSKISMSATILTWASFCECFVLCESENSPFCVCSTLTICMKWAVIGTPFACDVKPLSAPFIWVWSLCFTYTDGEPGEIAEIICGHERVYSWGQFTPTREREFFPHVRHSVMSALQMSHVCLLCVDTEKKSVTVRVCVCVCLQADGQAAAGEWGADKEACSSGGSSQLQ